MIKQQIKESIEQIIGMFLNNEIDCDHYEFLMQNWSHLQIKNVSINKLGDSINVNLKEYVDEM